jgi:hypothetical protein
MTTARLAMLLSFSCSCAVGLSACGGDGNGGPSGPSGLLPDLPQPTASVAGGYVEAASGSGTNGGEMKLTSRGELVLDPAIAAADAPAAPALPEGAPVTAAELAADFSHDGTIRIDGTVAAGGADAVRTITATSGDIVIAGTLSGADLGGGTQGLSLNAPAGTVYVSGTLSTAGAAATTGDGHVGGAITITALNIVISGSVTSAGGNGVSAGGAGGAITLTAAGGIAASGGIDSLGGEARGDGASTGGNGGAIQLTAGGDVLIGRTRLHGGGGKSANGQAAGGAGAALAVDADGALRVTGILDARGGPAIAQGAGTAGNAGSISIGQTAPPSRIEMGVALALDGGAGPDAGGNGGALAFEARGGDLRCAGSMDVSGGSSVTRPGNAGSINGIVGPDAGGLSLSGKITGNGGDGQPGGSASGGVGGLLRIQITSLNGGYNIEGSGEFQFDGGASSGSGTAGAGGDMELVCMDGNSALLGKLLARGGEAPDAGGHGGGGGILHIWTDSNYNGVGGNFMIQPSGLIDVSGGAGSIGGDARNNGGEGVALFPEHQEQLSVLIDTETIQGNSQDGVVDNQGLIVSRGGVHGGAGGDVMFHGRRITGEDYTVSGPVQMEGDGAAPHGDFAGE